MRILYLVSTFPYPPTDGLKLRPFNIIKRFPTGHAIGLVCLGELKPEATATSLGAEQVFGLPDVMRRNSLLNITRRYPFPVYSIDPKKVRTHLSKIIDHFKPDIINCESLLLSYALCQWKLAVPVVNSFPDCNSLYRRQMVERAESLQGMLVERIKWLKMINYERDYYKCFNHIIVVADRDKNEILRLCGSIPITVIPNGVDCRFFDGNSVAPQTATIAFVGVMNYPPNVDAVLYFADNVLPLVRKHVPE